VPSSMSGWASHTCVQQGELRTPVLLVVRPTESSPGGRRGSKMSLARAAQCVQQFEQGSLTHRLASLEALFRDSDRRGAAKLCASQDLGPDLLQAALQLKKVAGQVNVLVHAAGILAALPSILTDSEVVQALSLGAGNTGRLFDLETNRRIAEFKF